MTVTSFCNKGTAAGQSPQPLQPHVLNAADNLGDGFSKKRAFDQVDLT